MKTVVVDVRDPELESCLDTDNEIEIARLRSDLRSRIKQPGWASRVLETE